MPALIPTADFIGIDGVTHLAAGGETPTLHDAAAAVARFFADKATGMPGRELMYATADRARAHLATLLGAKPEDIALLWNAAAGLTAIATAIDWREGDNIVVAASEFPSLLHAWRPTGAEIRRVGAGPIPANDEIAAATDGRTRLIVASHVSYLTGYRTDLAALRAIADRAGARLVIDASHALGVVPVDGTIPDVTVSCCYKWLLGTHGVGVFHVNPARWPEIAPHAIGWNSLDPAPDRRTIENPPLKPGLDRFEAGNPTFMSIYYLEAALARLTALGIDRIAEHVLALGGELHASLRALGIDPLTPADAQSRAGNICIPTDRSEAMEASLRTNNILTWSGDGRLRISVHAYNDEADISHALDHLRRLLN